jgi:hypothetical protein
MRSDVSAFTRGKLTKKKNSLALTDVDDTVQRFPLPSTQDAIAQTFPESNRKRQLNAIQCSQKVKMEKRLKESMQLSKSMQIGGHPARRMHTRMRFETVEPQSHHVHAVMDVLDFSSTHTSTPVPYARLPVDCCTATQAGIEFPKDAETVEWGFNGLKTVLPFARDPSDVSDI